MSTTISILCGKCRLYHASVDQVKQCFAGTQPATSIQSHSDALVGQCPEKGTFTISFPDGEWRTLRFTTRKVGNWAGKTIVSYLAGPDNGSDYVGFAHSENGTTNVWRKFKENVRIVEALKVLLRNDNDAQAAAGLAYAMESGNCFRCNRKLTVPASIHRGLGPDCADRM